MQVPNQKNGLKEADVSSDTGSSSLKPDLTLIKDSNQLIQIDIECLDKVFPIQIELLNQLTPVFNQSFTRAIEGQKVAGGMFGGTTHYKMNLRFDEAQGPLLMVNQTGKTQKMIDPLLDIFYEKSADWERPKMTDRTTKMTKGQCIFFNYQKEEKAAPLFAICTEDFQNQGFDHCTFGQVRGYLENLDIFKYRIRNISVVQERKIVQKNISFMGNDVKEKLNDQIKLVIRLSQLEQERKEVALNSARESQAAGEMGELQKKLEVAQNQLQKVEEKYKKELDGKEAEIGQLKQTLESEMGSKSKLLDQIKSKDSEIKQIGETGNQAKEEIQQKIQEQMQLKMENEKLKQKVEEETKERLAQKEQMQQSIAMEAKEKQVQIDIVKEKDAQLNSLTSELQTMKQSNQQLQSDTASAASSAQSATVELQKQMNQQAEDHVNALTAERGKYSQLQAHAGNLKKELEQLQLAMQQTEERSLQEKKSASEQAEGRVKELEAALQEKDAKLKQLESTSADLEQALKDSSGQLNSHKQALEEAKVQSEALKASIDNTNKSLTDAANQNQQLKQESEQRIKQLEQECQDLKTEKANGAQRVAEMESKDQAQQQEITKLQEMVDQMNQKSE